MTFLRASVARQGGLLPTSAHRLVDRKEAGRRRSPALRETVFGRKLGTLSVQYLEKVDVSPFIAGPRQPGGRCARFRGSLYVHEAVSIPRMGYQGIFSFFQGVEHRFLVGSQGYVVPGMRLGDLGVDPAE